MGEKKKIDGWQYYNHAAIPSVAPHIEPDLSPVKNGSIWNLAGGGIPLFARWTTEFDCGYETDWWYTVKDTPFDIGVLSSKKRNQIKKARRNFCVIEIQPDLYAESLYEVQVAAYSAYPEKYRPTVNKEKFIIGLSKWRGVTLGAFLKSDNTEENGRLCGYCLLQRVGNCYSYSVHKTMPSYEKLAVNFALVDGAMQYLEEDLKNGCYLSNGQRSTNHETSFNEVLEHSLGWRKAYCKLRIAYNPRIKWAVKLIYPFRSVLQHFNHIGLIHQIIAVLQMEEIARKQKE